jgi:hypothetical protein
LTARSFISGNWNLAQENIRLGENAIGNRFVGDCKCGCMRRMAMDDAVDIVSVFVDLDVE